MRHVMRHLHYLLLVLGATLPCTAISQQRPAEIDSTDDAEAARWRENRGDNSNSAQYPSSMPGTILTCIASLSSTCST